MAEFNFLIDVWFEAISEFKTDLVEIQGFGDSGLRSVSKVAGRQFSNQQASAIDIQFKARDETSNIQFERLHDIFRIRFALNVNVMLELTTDLDGNASECEAQLPATATYNVLLEVGVDKKENGEFAMSLDVTPENGEDDEWTLDVSSVTCAGSQDWDQFAPSQLRKMRDAIFEQSKVSIEQWPHVKTQSVLQRLFSPVKNSYAGATITDIEWVSDATGATYLYANAQGVFNVDPAGTASSVGGSAMPTPATTSSASRLSLVGVASLVVWRALF